MKIITGLVAVALTTAFTTVPMTMTSAGSIERACNKMDRKAATRSACSCIQRVANRNLSRKDQKLAAKFFHDPHLAQETRQSNSSSKERFWKRYKAWGEKANQSCS
jgi:hypothetical protein